MTNVSLNGLSELFDIQPYFLHAYVYFGDGVNGDHGNDATTALVILV